MTVRTEASGHDRPSVDMGIPLPRLAHVPFRRVGAVLAATALMASGLFLVTTQSAAIAATATVAAASKTARAVATPVSVSVVGNHLVNGEGQTIRLLGADRSGTEYACAQGWGIFDGPSSATSVATMRTWDINAVRVPLNEDCW